MIVVSIIGTDRFTAGYGPAKIAHEQAHLSGPIPVRVLRAEWLHSAPLMAAPPGLAGPGPAPRSLTRVIRAGSGTR